MKPEPGTDGEFTVTLTKPLPTGESDQLTRQPTRRRLRQPRLIVFVLGVDLLLARHVGAQTNATFVPSLSLSTVYDDNLFAKVSGDAGVMTLLRPAFEGTYESPTVMLSSLYSFDVQRSNFSALNSLDARRHGLFDISGRTTPAMTLAFGARYDRTDTPGELNLDTGVLGERRIAERWELIPSVVHRVRPRTTINASYNATAESLVDDVRGTLQTVRAGVTRETSPRTDVTVSYLGRHFVDRLQTQTSQAVLLGWSRELAFATRLTLQAGPRQSSYRGLNAEIVAGLTRSTNKIRMAIDYWHGETIILGFLGPVEVDSGSAKVVWPVTQHLEIGTHARVTDSATFDNGDVRVYRLVLLGAWTPRGGPATVTVSYGADFQHGVIRGSLFLNDQVMRHTFRVNLTVAPRLSRRSRSTGEPPVVHPLEVAQ
jgi:hypothetical protein